MSGLVGHTLYAILSAEAADEKRLAAAAIMRRHFASYLTGAYLGCDVQTMPEAVCEHTGKEIGYGTVPLEKSPLTGGSVRPWSLAHDGRKYRPKEIHELFYGRAHLVFGWAGAETNLAVPWDHLADYCSLTVQDSLEESQPSERSLAYLFGWMVHIVGDSLIKSVRPGIKMKLLDGAYTPRNRPIQDLFAFHKIGIGEFRLNWERLFHDMAATTVEPVQLHYMRVGDSRGRLGKVFAEGWRPERRSLLQAVLAENRRWLPHHAADVLAAMKLTPAANGSAVSKEVRSAVGELTYEQMMDMAERSQLRQTLATIQDESLKLFERVIAQVPKLRSQAGGEAPSWEQVMQRWRI